MRKLNNTTLLRTKGTLLFGLQHNDLASYVHIVQFAHMNYRDTSTIRWRPERRVPLFHNMVVILSYLIPELFLSILLVQP